MTGSSICAGALRDPPMSHRYIRAQQAAGDPHPWTVRRSASLKKNKGTGRGSPDDLVHFTKALSSEIRRRSALSLGMSSGAAGGRSRRGSKGPSSSLVRWDEPFQWRVGSHVFGLVFKAFSRTPRDRFLVRPLLVARRSLSVACREWWKELEFHRFLPYHCPRANLPAGRRSSVFWISSQEIACVSARNLITRLVGRRVLRPIFAEKVVGASRANICRRR